jgi:peptidoglycan/xylan/chitin deacetylase (PgdA/CDA1 family)
MLNSSSPNRLPAGGERIVTTSWDDGYPLDLRIAEMLSSRSLLGTFYVPLKGYEGLETLSDADLRSLYTSDFEIGAHGVSHKTLRRLCSEELEREVTVCKQKLQHCLGREITMFCYPNGHYDRRVLEAVKRAGYAGARTCRMCLIDRNFRAFEMPTSMQAFPHSRHRYLRNIGRSGDFSLMWKYVTELSRCRNWIELGKHLFDVVLERGGVWHLYGHSWEIETLQLWEGLEELLDYVAHRTNVIYTTNGGARRILNGGGTQFPQRRGPDRITAPMPLYQELR